MPGDAILKIWLGTITRTASLQQWRLGPLWWHRERLLSLLWCRASKWWWCGLPWPTTSMLIGGLFWSSLHWTILLPVSSALWTAHHSFSCTPKTNLSHLQKNWCCVKNSGHLHLTYDWSWAIENLKGGSWMRRSYYLLGCLEQIVIVVHNSSEKALKCCQRWTAVDVLINSKSAASAVSSVRSGVTLVLANMCNLLNLFDLSAFIVMYCVFWLFFVTIILNSSLYDQCASSEVKQRAPFRMQLHNVFPASFMQASNVSYADAAVKRVGCQWRRFWRCEHICASP